MPDQSNLPPGVSVNDIPGNRPEDVAEEAFWAVLDNKFAEEHPRYRNVIYNLVGADQIWDDAIIAYVTMARDIGYNQGFAEGVDQERMDEYERQNS